MIIEDEYVINPKFMFMMGYYSRQGQLCTEITETSRTFIIKRSPFEIFNNSILALGFDLRGVLDTSKWLLGNANMCPIMVNPLHKLVLFLTYPPKHIEAIWLNPNHIHSASGSNKLTFIVFKNGKTIISPIGISVFNKFLENAKQLEEMTVQSVDKPFTFILDPKDRYKSKN